MKKFVKILLVSIATCVVIGLLGLVGYVVYRNLTVERALLQARQFTFQKPTSSNSRSDPPMHLRPRPWSSPLHNREFDDAVGNAAGAYDQGNYDRAIALNTRALEIHPSQDMVWLLLTRRGDCYLAKDDADKALADYDQAALLGELDSHTLISRAFALRMKGRREEAMKAFEAAIAVNPRDSLIYFNRAAILAEDGNLNGAQADYAKALELVPKNVAWRLTYAELCLRQKRSQQAIAQATIALKVDPNSARAYLVRAKAYGQLRLNSDALSDLDTAANLKNVDRAATLNDVAWCRATCQQDSLRDGRKAVAEATSACELSHWKNSRYVDTLAAAYAEAGDFDNAATFEEQALKMSPASGNQPSRMKQRLDIYKQGKPHRE